MARLAQASGCLDPAEDFLDPLTDAQADFVARMPCRPTIQSAPSLDAVLIDILVPGDMRRDLALTERCDELPSIIGLVRSERDPPLDPSRSTSVSAASRSAVPVAGVNVAPTTKPFRFSIRT